MRKIITMFVLSFFPFCIVFGQNAVLHITLANGKVASGFVNIPSQPGNGSYSIILKDSSTAIYTFKLTRPEFVQAYCFSSDNMQGKYFNYLFYLSPGDNLELKANFNEPEFGIKVSGKGSNNNQPLMSAKETIDVHGFYRDTLPYRVISAINAAQKSLESNLKKYIKLYNPSQSYTHDWKISLRYYASDLYYNFKASNKNYVWQAYYRNYAQWQKITDSLFGVVKLNNDAALATYHYADLITGFLYGEKVHLSDEEYLHPEAFYREWYHTDTVIGKKQFSADPKNLVQEKIINRYFTGKTAEYMYAVLFDGAVNGSNPKNIPEIFRRFKEKYPNSEYIAQFSQHINTIVAKQKQTLNEKMVFMDDNGTKLNTLDDVLAVMKGKTVLVDMWGTWCGPCREEIEKNSAAIREHFKDKGLTYLYIANDDMDNQEQWKKLIAYFDMEGTHLLANKKLTDDIMAKVKGRGFPTVFIIKKDGTFEQSKSAYPIKRDILFKQLEKALAL
jgi:thiol-disulfide isomerase/thioredoxin